MSKTLKITVTGSRDKKYETEFYKEQVFYWLDLLHSIVGIAYLAEGGARGFDSLAKQWREDRKIDGKTFKAEWDKYKRPYGKNPAGMIRNAKMLDEVRPEMVVLFPGGPGTKGMGDLARERKLNVIRILQIFDTPEEVAEHRAIVNQLQSYKEAEAVAEPHPDESNNVAPEGVFA